MKAVPVKGLFLDTSKTSSFHSLAADQALIKPQDRPFAPMAVLGASSMIRVLVNYLAHIGGFNIQFFSEADKAYKWLEYFPVCNKVFMEKYSSR